ncbi:hypothetical protein C0Q70_18965 [Pomacea canaliculata]|uniref:Uncharacterized protein n=1 Tax=Pomacea canaliculata TaxID=400727 RepID=A0A2T7NI06_POMCA|nr:hypothetical protein C0Q70_18965 [Pomacea canaliculata]
MGRTLHVTVLSTLPKEEGWELAVVRHVLVATEGGVDESLHPDSCCRVAAPRQRGAGARVTWQVQGPSPRITILMSYGCHSEVLSSTAAHACITRTTARAGPYQQHGPRLWQQRDHCLTGWMDGRWNQRLAVTSGDLIAVMIWKNDC